MVGSTRQGSRVTGTFWRAGVVALLLAAGCQNSSDGDPSISADSDRGAGGKLESLKVEGSRFTPNGPVLVTMLMSATGASTSPYVEETIQADADGKITFERRPVACPPATDFQRGSWVRVVVRDMTSGISGSEVLSPGAQPDCGA